MALSLTTILESHRGQGVLGGGEVWHLEGSSPLVEQCKTELLEAICRESRAFVHYEESPVGLAGLDGATRVGSAWQLPTGVGGAVLLNWLYLGNWQLYVNAEPLPRIPDLCRSTDAEIEAFLVKSGATAIIDSFHDDVSWSVGVLGGA